MRDRLLDQHLRLFARALGAEQRDEGLPCRASRILAQRLAGGGLVALDVEQVVGDLEGEADVAGITPQLVRAFDRDPAHDRARLEAEADQRAGLELLQPGDRRQVERLASAAISIIWPPAMPDGPDAAPVRKTSSARTKGSWWVAGIGQHLEGERVQRSRRPAPPSPRRRRVWTVGLPRRMSSSSMHGRSSWIRLVDVDRLDRDAGAHRSAPVDV